jgi:phosphoribosylaminoimidazole-succinocarboxamide synthase
LATRLLVSEGTGKKIFEDDSEDYVILEFKDYLVDKKLNTKTKVKNKGCINASISVNLFEYLSSYHIRNHFSKKSDEKEIVVKKLEMIPLEILIRNYASGKFCKTYGYNEGEYLNSPVLEFYLKDEKLKKPQASESLIYTKEIASNEEVISIKKLACKTNAILKTYFERRNLKLVDIQLEFGRSNGDILIGDEISLDTCTLLEAENHTNAKTKSNQSMNAVYKTLHERIIGEN